MAKSKFKLLVYAGLLLVLLFSLVNVLLGLSGKAFSLEFLGVIVLSLLALIGFSGYRSWGERALFFVFLLYLLNLVLMWYFLGQMYVILLIIALIGFLLATPKKQKKSLKITRYSEPYSQVFDAPDSKNKKESKEEKEAIGEDKTPKAKAESKAEKEVKEVKKAKAVYNPGKYVASKNSNNYHEPKCDWAKKIKDERRIWFKSKEEAWEKGFKAHSCVEG